MSENDNALPRRRFLQVAAGGLLACTTAPLRAQELNATGAPTASPRPAKPVILKSPELEVTLDGERGVPHEFRLARNGGRIGGEISGRPLHVTICPRGAAECVVVAVVARETAASPQRVDFHFAASASAHPAATFTVRYVVDRATLHVSLEDVVEQPGFEFIELAMPSLVSVHESDGAGWLAHGDEGGSLALLADATPASLPPNTFWGKVLATLPVLMIGNSGVTCVQEVTSLMDGSELGVAGEPGSRVATLGTIKTHRVNGHACYDMNLGSGAPRNCGTAQTPNLLIGARSVCRLDFLPATGDGSQVWLAAAKLVRDRMPAIPTHYYDRRVVYGIRCDEPKFDKPAATFDDCRKLISDIDELTDGAPQVAHLWGWQYRGKDTGYPAVAEVNPRLGGYDRMMRLMDEGRALNCTVTLSDNYDDAYRSSPEWDERIIARRPDGELWKSRNWTGEDSYIIGMAKYMAGPGAKRPVYTAERYRLRETTHIDVLSYFPIRNDWDPEHPASGIQNLAARFRVVDDFRQRGIDVSSEALRYAFIGKVSCFWNTPNPRACPFGGKPIPLMPLIYRKSAVWGQGGSRSAAERLLFMLFYNAPSHMIVRADMPRSEITDYFYLMMLPWFHLHSRNIEGFRRDGEKTRIDLEGGARVDIDWNTKQYAVTRGDETITRDGATACPIDTDRIAFYSTAAQEMSAALPQGWNARELAARSIALGERKTAPVTASGNRIRVSVPAQTPVIVYRNAGIADRRSQS